MNEKGFTLIEVLAVVIIISLLVIMAMPQISNSVKNYSSKTDKLMMTMIEEATKMYIQDNSNLLKKTEEGYYCVPIINLVNGEYLKKDIELNGEDITNNKSLKINYSEDNKIEIVDTNKCVVTELADSLAPGLYDENDNLIYTWDELTSADYMSFTYYNEDDEMVTTGMLYVNEEGELTSAADGVTGENEANEYLKGKLVIDESVVYINWLGLENLTSVVIPNSVTSIGDSAFTYNQLTSVVIPDSVTTIGSYAFAYNQLTSVVIPDSVTTIGSYAFAYNQLTSVVIPDSVTSIGDFAFSNNQLTSVTIENGITNIGSDAFSNNQLTSVEIPDSVTSIGEYAFSGNQLTSVIIPDSVIEIGYYAFYGNKITDLIIGTGVTTIVDESFALNQLTSVVIKGKSSIDDFEYFGYAVFSWAEGYSDDDIIWEP